MRVVPEHNGWAGRVVPVSPLDGGEELAGQGAELVELIGRQRVDDHPAYGAHVGGCRPFDRGATSLGDPDEGSTTVLGATDAREQAAGLHPLDVVGQAAAVPLHRRREL